MKDIEEHEDSCDYALTECIYKNNGCEYKDIKTKLFFHEQEC